MKFSQRFLEILVLVLFLYSNLYSQDLNMRTISEDAGIQTDRRPISVGLYDSTVNKTFVSWMGSYSHPMIKEFNHTSKTWGQDIQAGLSPFADKHNYPGLLQAIDGRLLIFYGAHNSVLKVTTSQNPNSIDGTWNDRELVNAQGATYPAPIITKDGTIYCFYRITMKDIYTSDNYPTDYRPLGFVKSSDNGESWEYAVKLIDNYPREDNLCEIYNGKISYQPANDSVSERIHIAWSIAGGGPDNHQHNLYRRNIYYAYLNLLNNHVYNIDGDDLGLDIDNYEAENKCKVLVNEAPPLGENTGYQVSVSYMDNGKPLIVFQFENLKSAIWNGSNWVINEVAVTTGEPREIEKIGANSFSVYRTAGKNIYIYSTDDGGNSWSNTDKIVAPVDLARCYVINNYRDELKLLMTESKSDGYNVEESNRDILVAGYVNVADSIFQLTINTIGKGIIENSPEGNTFLKGTEVELSATPVMGWEFSGWSGDLIDTNSATTIIMNNNKNITATFEESNDVEIIEIPIVNVTASTFQNPNVPQNSFDNNLNTRWSAEGNPQFITYDLGSIYKVGYITTAWYNGDMRKSYFDIELSSDDISWDNVYSGETSGTTVEQEPTYFPVTEGRFLRIIGKGNTVNLWNSITEVDIYGIKNNPTSISKNLKNGSLSYNLNQNYPNPFNPTTNINFSIPEKTFVSLTIYNSLGQKIEQLISGFYNSGKYSVEFNASKLSSGTYYYRLTTDSFTDIKKAILLK